MSLLRSVVKRLAVALLVAVMATGVIGSTAPALAGTVSVVMGKTGLDFSPTTVTISPGDTVHFEVGMLDPHNVVFDAANSSGDVSSLSHPALAMSGGFDVEFPADAASGTYNYYCEPHRGAPMAGKIVVQ